MFTLFLSYLANHENEFLQLKQAAVHKNHVMTFSNDQMLNSVLQSSILYCCLTV